MDMGRPVVISHQGINRIQIFLCSFLAANFWARGSLLSTLAFSLTQVLQTPCG
jgi:hypothetical protein